MSSVLEKGYGVQCATKAARAQGEGGGGKALKVWPKGIFGDL